ncbi:MAG: DUF3761 domain-containing protein [Steroidobacteraceae bacterium]
MRTFPLVRMMVPSLVLLVSGFAVQTAGAQAAAAPTACKDGTTSSATGRGACSGHGGVQKASSSGSTGSSSAPAATPPPSSSVPPSGTMSKPTAPATTAATSSASAKSTTGNMDPTGATAKCKDGTYSKAKNHTGACSKHGGVDQWLDGSK